MSRPRPLTSTAAYRNVDQQLTPRTPHSGSRTSRLEQGFSKIPLSEPNDAEDDGQDALQSAPLLASSSTARFSIHTSRRRPNPNTTSSSDRDGKRPMQHPVQILYRTVSRLPLAFGIFVAGLLLILVVVSYMRPEALHRYVGAKAPTPSSSSSTTPHAKSSKPHAHSSAGTDIHIISYENYTTFPLHANEYLAECNKQHQGYMSHGEYWDISPMGAMDVLHAEDDDDQPKTVCSSTITYMLDGTVGLSADLALMAQAAAMAHERNRTFFVEDAHWNRGKWLDHFEDVAKGQPGPEPGCRPPPPDELVACPRTARHWVITARTAKFHFGHGFADKYENPYQHQLNRLKPIFDSAGQSLESIIVPNKYNMQLIQLARQELASFIHDVNKESDAKSSPYVAVHVRRGDRKTLSYTYLDRKIPLHEYSEAVMSTWKRLHPDSGTSGTRPVVYLATDSPEVFEQFSEVYQGYYFSLYDTSDPRLRSIASPGEYYQNTFNEIDVHERITATRGMVVDLALVSGLWPGDDEEEMLPEAVVCALSSSVCRLSAIGLGWANAFGHINEEGAIDEKNKHWVEIDQKGQVVPVWQAFELF